jgi:hypothetical protein
MGACAVALTIASVWCLSTGAKAARAQEQLPDLDLLATSQMFPDVGSGLRAIHKDARGRYYVLTHSAPAVFVYGKSGKRLAQIPARPTRETSLIAGADFDLGSNGYLYVVDQGANDVKIFDDDGRLAQVINVTDPESVAALPNGQLALTSLQANNLVEVLDQTGNQVRAFGELETMARRRDINHSLNAGRVLSVGDAHLYFAFTYLPEPTVRRYDMTGKSSLEISLQTLEFYPSAVSTRRRISEDEEQDRHGNLTLHPIINAFGVDPQSGDVWIAMDDELTHFDRNGNRIGATYRTFAEEDVRFVPVSILVEPDRLVMAADPTGVYVFPRPDKAPGVDLTPASATTPPKGAATEAPKTSGPPESPTTTPPTIPENAPQPPPH